ncbi:ATP synthase F1 subunit epsilon [Polluticoccus soli]|uniref:ATP synthase F1 subunit epsilon n=1 Tax=Polluticoccus soli TaxID=3034150 RepID=UPI0023E2ED8B|nr:ATP synthase F1 subunit epsilon [Flavipsychrobacter sp. JY13-12]
MQLDILTPEHKVYSGTVSGVQLPGIEGSFEILDKHAPMIATLGKGKMKIIKDKNTTELYEISGGFVEVLNNKASVLIESATALD